ncbi:MAC/perforin domain-containing protein [Pedobacter sp. KR3-3]|uniref:MAC/perforin domain-containing protein n=1 Tax=Pedobacter albus TaxID=3113905 RepID=A0ABU7I210_9SPHI|nr:MAC/perforin domain-containing protein [Pedobacter sp. KR3-3]MEE1943493.1 MAC/perforin domain-containing protein [Pedobacter sp. KR3-3]
MKKTILALAVLATLASCKKNTDQITKPEEEKFSPDIAVAITDGQLLNDQTQQGDATYNLLGYGYDVTDQYNDVHSVRPAVINVAAYVSANPGRFNPNKSTTGYWVNFSGENAADLAAQLSNKVDQTNGLKAFGNTISAAFPGANSFDGKYVYGYYSQIAVRARLSITDGANSLYTSYLSTAFAQDVNTLSAADLVKKYGTHVLIKIDLGAKINVVYQAEAPKTDRKKISAAGLRYAMKNIFGLGTGELDPMDLKALNANTGAKIYYDAFGGDQSKLKVIKINNKSVINTTEWLNSATEEKARFIGVSSEGGLIPLYELVADATKKAEVKSYITTYIQTREVKVQN